MVRQTCQYSVGYRSSKEAWKSEEGAGEQGRGGGGEGGEVCGAVRREWERRWRGKEGDLEVKEEKCVVQ